MKKTIMILSALVLFLLVSNPACKSFVWDPTGIWTVTFNFYAEAYIFNEQLTFSGGESGGSVNGFTFDGDTWPQTGTWTKTGDFTLTVYIHFNTWGEDVTINLTLNSTEETPNSMTGSGTDQEDSDIYPVNITATKVSNLQ